MPKLIIKQEVASGARKRSLAKWLSLGGLLTLLLTVAAAAAFFTKKPLPTSDLEPLTFESATVDADGYQSLQSILGDLMAEYTRLAERGLDDYQKNLMLSGKAESILTHLSKMSEAADQLGLNTKEYREVTDRHQFYKDFWQAKLHFRELRISRFENTGTKDGLSDASLLGEVQLTGDETLAIAEQPKKKFQFAKPPEGMEMPAGFCDLSNPDSCKAEDGPAIAVIDEGAAAQQPKKKFQFAKPPKGMEMPAGFCDLSNPDSCKAEGEPAVALIDEGATTQPKKKFQFAKPPEGMEMPAGFCDLSNPDSCKAENDPAIAVINEGGAAQQPKKKFQFAKPPKGMEMPAGFCDLSNPAGCKKEGDLLSDVDKPSLDAVVEEPENKDQL